MTVNIVISSYIRKKLMSNYKHNKLKSQIDM
jgi:hypothetical protein